MRQEFFENVGLISFFVSFITASLAITISMNSHYRSERNLPPSSYRMLSWFFGLICVPSSLLIVCFPYAGSLYFLDALIIVGVWYFYGKYLKNLK